VDVTGIEPVTPCLQTLGAREISNLAYVDTESHQPLQLATRTGLNFNREITSSTQ